MPTNFDTFLTERRIGITVTYGAPFNDTFRDADGWTVRLTHRPVEGRRRTLTVPFYKGRGHHGEEPRASEVLSCLLSDAASVNDTRSFTEWCADLGYDTDSRKAEATYRACERIARKLARFLGDDYPAFLTASADY